MLRIELRASVTLDNEINASPPNYSSQLSKEPFGFRDQVSRTALVRPGICLIAQPGQEPAFLVSQPPKCWTIGLSQKMPKEF